MTPPSDGTHDDLDRLREQLQRLRAGGSFQAFLDLTGVDEPGGPHVRDDVAAQLDPLCRVLEVLTVEDWRNPLELPGPRLLSIAESAGLEVARVPPLIGKLVAIARMMTASAVRTLCDEPPAPEPPEGTPSPSALIRRIDLFSLLSPAQRSDLRYRWDLMARVGRGPEYDRPLFAIWNQNLRLFDMLSDPKPTVARAGPGEDAR